MYPSDASLRTTAVGTRPEIKQVQKAITELGKRRKQIEQRMRQA